MKANIVKAALFVSILSLIGKLFGFVREMTFASLYGISINMDIYIIAAMIPSMIGGIFQDGIISGFLPSYQEYLHNKNISKANQLFTMVVMFLILISIFLLFVQYFWGGNIVAMLAPGYSTDLRNATIELMYMMFPCILLYGLFGLASAVQQAEHQFIYPALSSLFFNIVIIMIIVSCSENYGIYAAAVATTMGVLAQLLVQVPGIVKRNVKWQLDFSSMKSLAKQIIKNIGPVVVMIAIMNSSVIADRIVSSELEAGSISALNYAYRLNLFFISIFITPLSTVIFPSLSEHMASQNVNEFIALFNKTVRYIAFVMLPLTMLVFVFRLQFVEILLQRGVFDSVATQVTANALAWYCIGIFSFAMLDLLNKSFYAQKNTRIPLFVSVIIVGMNIYLDITLVTPMAHSGIAFANSVAVTTGVLILGGLLRNRIGAFGGKRIFISIAKSGFASILMAIACIVIYRELFNILGTLLFNSVILQLITLTLSVVIGLIIYLIILFIIKSEEIMLFFIIAKAKLPIFKISC